MKLRKTGLTLLTVAVFSLAAFSGAIAQEGEPPAACSGDNVAGTVVAVDEASQTITVELSDGTMCTVQLSAGYDHPITSLLGTYFNDMSAESLAEALAALQVSLVCPEGEACSLAEAGDDTVSGRVVGVTEVGEGQYEVEIVYSNAEGTETSVVILVEDAAQAAAWMEALAGLNVEWMLRLGDDAVFVVDAGDQIAALHEDGMGFGVIVKLMAMADAAAEACLAGAPEGLEEGAADPCAVSLESLVAAFQGGMGLGQLFQEFGKPALLGVGHIRQLLNGKDPGPPPNACGYWSKHGDPYGTCGGAETGEPAGPSNNGNGRGKPPWAGQPGGPQGD